MPRFKDEGRPIAEKIATGDWCGDGAQMITRVQRKRTKGFRLPSGTVCVTRPGPLGNPFNWRDGVEIGNEAWAKGVAVDLFRKAVFQPNDYPGKIVPTREAIRAALTGKSFVACWCKLSDPCHGDVLIAIAVQP